MNGGLANQAFQYMFGMRLQQELGESVIFDDSYFDSIDKVRPHSNNANSQRRLLKKIFNINVIELSSLFTNAEWNSMLKICHTNKISMIRLINEQKKFLMISETSDHDFNESTVPFNIAKLNFKQ